MKLSNSIAWAALALQAALAEPIPSDLVNLIRGLEKRAAHEPIGRRGSPDNKLLLRAAQMCAVTYNPQNNEAEKDSQISIESFKDKSNECIYKDLANKDSIKIKLAKTSDGVTHINADMRALIIVDDEAKINWVAFRGSSSLPNWLKNFEMKQDDCGDNDAKCHDGFLKSFNSVKDDIKKALQEAVDKNKDYKTIYTGHSLGGAVATIARFLLGDELPGALTTFGSPRAGNQAMVDKISSQKGDVARITHSVDPVPHVPPAAEKPKHFEVGNWRHVKPNYHNTGDDWENPQWDESDKNYDKDHGSDSADSKFNSEGLGAHRGYYTKALSAAGADDLKRRDMDTRGLTSDATVDDDFTKLDDDIREKLEEEVEHDKEDDELTDDDMEKLQEEADHDQANPPPPPPK